MASKQWGKVLPSSQHSYKPKAREGMKTSDLKGEMQAGKELLPRGEGGDTISAHAGKVLCSQEVQRSQYLLTLECSHFLAGVSSSSEKKTFSRGF